VEDTWMSDRSSVSDWRGGWKEGRTDSATSMLPRQCYRSLLRCGRYILEKRGVWLPALNRMGRLTVPSLASLSNPNLFSAKISTRTHRSRFITPINCHYIAVTSICAFL
jgi:hypothetical protein